MIQERRKDLEIQTHTAMFSICRVLHVCPLCLTVILQARNGGKHTAHYLCIMLKMTIMLTNLGGECEQDHCALCYFPGHIVRVQIHNLLLA